MHIYKIWIKFLSIFLGIGLVAGGLTTAFVIAGQKNNGLNQFFILDKDETIIKPLFENDRIKDNPQYEWEISYQENNPTDSFNIINIVDLKNPTTLGDNKYFKSDFKDGEVVITILPLSDDDKKDGYPKKGQPVDGDPLAPFKRDDKLFPMLRLTADNVKTPLIIYLVIIQN